MFRSGRKIEKTGNGNGVTIKLFHLTPASPERRGAYITANFSVSFIE